MSTDTKLPSLLPKKVKDSAIDSHVHKVFPNDLNANKTMFGGQVMAIADRLSLVAAERHSSHVCVTASVDSIHFISPARENDTLIFSVAVNHAWTTSMEVGVKIVAENSYTGEVRNVVSAYSTFVALKDGKPVAVPSIIPESEVECKRYKAAQVRRDLRLQTRESLKKYKTNS